MLNVEKKVKVKKMWSQVFTMEGVECSFSMSVNCQVYQVGVQCGVLSPKDGMEIFCFFPGFWNRSCNVEMSQEGHSCHVSAASHISTAHPKQNLKKKTTSHTHTKTRISFETSTTLDTLKPSKRRGFEDKRTMSVHSERSQKYNTTYMLE